MLSSRSQISLNESHCDRVNFSQGKLLGSEIANTFQILNALVTFPLWMKLPTLSTCSVYILLSCRGFSWDADRFFLRNVNWPSSGSSGIQGRCTSVMKAEQGASWHGCVVRGQSFVVDLFITSQCRERSRLLLVLKTDSTLVPLHHGVFKNVEQKNLWRTIS